MNLQTKRKVTIRTREEKQALCEQWKASGKTKSYFCKENNIPLASFFPWCNKLWPELKESAPNILPVKIINKNASISNTQVEQTDVELLLGTNTTIRFKLPIKNLVTFIQELSHAVATIR